MNRRGLPCVWLESALFEFLFFLEFGVVEILPLKVLLLFIVKSSMNVLRRVQPLLLILRVSLQFAFEFVWDQQHMSTLV